MTVAICHAGLSTYGACHVHEANAVMGLRQPEWPARHRKKKSQISLPVSLKP
jgi:hypothetical protein